MSTAVIENPSPAPLPALDLCARCGAQVYHLLTFAPGELLFCGHHRSKHAEKLQQVGLHHPNASEKFQ